MSARALNPELGHELRTSVEKRAYFSGHGCADRNLARMEVLPGQLFVVGAVGLSGVTLYVVRRKITVRPGGSLVAAAASSSCVAN